VSIKDAYENGHFGLSFELFPPKTPESEAMMWRTVEDLVAFEPSMITCTYGAGGSTRGTTLDVIEGVRSRHNLPVASHLTCVGSSAASRFRSRASSLAREVSPEGRGCSMEGENTTAIRGDYRTSSSTLAEWALNSGA